MLRLREFLAAGALIGATFVAVPQAATAATPSDDLCGDQAPVFSQEAPPALSILQAESAWSITKGAGVTVAIVDSGVNGADPRLASRMVGGRDLVGGGEPNGGTDLFGHGTAIAGIIAAQPTSASALVGLAPGVKIMSMRVYTTTDQEEVENGRGAKPQRVADGIRAAADAGAEIINVALSTPYGSTALEEAVQYATARGSLVVASAGNADTSTDFTIGAVEEQVDGPRLPAAGKGAIGVSALSAAEAEGAGLEVTDATVVGPHVDLASPGQQILTTGLNGADCWIDTPAPSTSYATAYVSAAAALVAAAHPRETPEQWSYRLTATALRGNPDDRDDAYGWGIVQPYEAITLVPSAETRGPVPNPFAPTATETAAPVAEGITIAGPDGRHEADVTRTTYVFLATTGVLALASIIGVWAAMRRRRPATERQPTREA